MKRRFEKVISGIKNSILDLFSRKQVLMPLQLTRVTEKFDIVMRPPFRGGIGDRIKQ